MRTKPVGLEVSVSARQDGTLEALYIRLTNRKIARTKEIVQDQVLADYDSKGDLVGIEVLAPVKLSTLSRLVAPPKRKTFNKVLRQAAPEELVLT